MDRLEASVCAETKYYDSVDSKRRKGLFERVVEGWVSSEDIENSRILFHYPLLLSEGQERESVYVNKEDIVIKVVDGLGVTLDADAEERFDDMYYECHMTDKQLEEYEKSNLTEEEVEILHKNTMKHSTPIGGSYFDDETKMRPATPEEQEAVDEYLESISTPTGINFCDEIKQARSIKVKSGVTYDYNSYRIGHLINDYELVKEEGELVTVKHRPTSRNYQFLKDNLIYL